MGGLRWSWRSGKRQAGQPRHGRHEWVASAGLELRARLADWHQAQGFLVHGKCQYALHLGIIECADYYGPELEPYGLQMDVLSGVPDLHVHIAFRTLLIFPGGSLVNRGDGNCYRCIVQPILLQCRISQLCSLVPVDNWNQVVARRLISVNAGGQLILATRYEKDLQRVERASRRGRALALRVDNSLGAQRSWETSASVSASFRNSRTDRRRRKADSTDVLLSSRGSGSLITPTRSPLTRGFPTISISRMKLRPSGAE